MTHFARDLGFDGPPFRWDPERRALLRAELDAYYAYLYGLNRDELRYILDPKEVMGEDWPSETFRVLKDREKKEFGEYRTRRLVLEAWDRFVADGTFDLTRLNDPATYQVVKAQLAASREAEAEQKRLMAKAGESAGPVLFVEGASDIPILEAAWRAFRGPEPLPVRVIAAGGTTQLKSLAARGGALKKLLGDRLVLALADNDGAGREVAKDKRVHQGGRFVPFDNGVRWALLQPTEEFRAVMAEHNVPEAFWPFTVEQAFSAATRRAALEADAYGIADEPPADFFADGGPAKKLFPVLAKLTPDDDACFYLKAPHPDKKLAFSDWVTAPERRTPEVFAAFKALVDAIAAQVAQP